LTNISMLMLSFVILHVGRGIKEQEIRSKNNMYLNTLKRLSKMDESMFYKFVVPGVFIVALAVGIFLVWYKKNYGDEE